MHLLPLPPASRERLCWPIGSAPLLELPAQAVEAVEQLRRPRVLGLEPRLVLEQRRARARHVERRRRGWLVAHGVQAAEQVRWEPLREADEEVADLSLDCQSELAPPRPDEARDEGVHGALPRSDPAPDRPARHLAVLCDVVGGRGKDGPQGRHLGRPAARRDDRADVCVACLHALPQALAQQRREGLLDRPAKEAANRLADHPRAARGRSQRARPRGGGDALVGGGCRVKQHPRHDVLHARGEPREQLVVLGERVAHRRLADGAPVAERVVLRVDAERVGELFVGD
mmetsp:Transcript_7645/g.25160  ORF Transcript_7645/g.25160 Transcript_7645/m.25160 type:complete len:287 (+) Transcript_7645:170-1030(+)